MSTGYCICNRKKREEVQAFNKFWEEKLIPGLKQQINDYCGENAGEYINADFAEDIIDGEVSKISHAPWDSDSYETEICSTHWSGNRVLCQWEGIYTDEYVVRDETSLVEFFARKENRERYCITDEYGKEYTLAEFLDVIKCSRK